MCRAQSAADLQTLADFKTASKQMQLEAEGVTPFRLEATFSTSDFMGRPDNQGRWTEEFAKVGTSRRTVKDSTSPENYAPEDQANIGPAPPTMSGTFMQRMLIEAMLRPGPTDEAIEKSKITYKTQKIGQVSLRCVILEPNTVKAPYARRAGTRAYCLEADRPIIRFSELAYGTSATYNALARFGDRWFAQQVTLAQRGKERGKLQVTKLVAAPELLRANLPENPAEVSAPEQLSGEFKVGSGEAEQHIVKKVAPVYPLDSKQKHISGSVLLRAIISKEGRIESLEVISAPADDLAESAVEAVSQWIYKPYLKNGQPKEVDTTITVNYRFG
ncbi:energy transducer TonB [Terriglobus aquaticus]|uniref:Energy transducer TonB n=1 Tax=Terriglobus aquaticus TaxID=940139 RepID=A0ABW9KJE7_9BACT